MINILRLRGFHTNGQENHCTNGNHFNNQAVEAQILKETDPAKIKRLGRRVKIDAAEWERVSCDIMKRGIWAKFSSDKTLKRYLKATYPNILAESSPTDLKWGTGYGQTDPNAHDPKLWRGRNLLGKALMEVRENIMKRDRSPLGSDRFEASAPEVEDEVEGEIDFSLYDMFGNNNNADDEVKLEENSEEEFAYATPKMFEDDDKFGDETHEYRCSCKRCDKS
ncbi:unnamed protein product [Mytilus coruscus]|uniref:NADAR domain-containing protein n=1 Tax=Mytilus coruscus TaxID=42192 RepID=A0A6J8BC02_MYTCO|nr:unnamed protein product [Mytilus coruscus]